MSMQHRTTAGGKRRGTVLLMIVGVLALMAIIAVVYAAIAQADRRGAAAFARANQIDDHVDLVRDYIAGVIGDARLDTYADRVPNAPATVTRLNRKAWDAPSVNPNMRTVFGQFAPLPGEQEVAYSATGGAFTPWLASIEPTELPTAAARQPAPVSMKPYISARDWFSITNICPDGRFVNLANLRNNFQAEPGYRVDARGRRRMSEGLTLFDAAGNVQAANGTILLPNGATASEFVPEHWTMRQVHAFRPSRDLDRRPTAPDPGADEYLLNQWADADGDGIVDARWFEMVRLDPTSPLNNPFVEALLPQDPSIRWFYAAKIADNSGRVNVNTATDQTAAPAYNVSSPGTAYKLGLSPADVDLRGLLSMSGVYNRYVHNNTPSGYDRFLQPTDVNDPTNYNRPAQPYQQLEARAVGQYGYGALREAISSSVIPRPAPQQPSVPGAWDNLINNRFGTLSTRLAYYEQSGNLPQGEFVQTTIAGMPATAVDSRGLLGIESELDLRAFGSANDFARRSDLEAIIDGRADKAPFIMPWYGSLRSNRPETLERFSKAQINGLATEAAMLMAFADVRSHLTTVSGGSPLSSLTPSSLAEADPDVIADEEVKVDVTQVLKLPRSSTNVFNDQDRLNYIDHLVDALMPYRFDPAAPMDATRNSWDKRVTGAAWKRAVNYGGSAEFAYRSLLHLAVNTWDAIDNDNDTDDDIAGPTAISVRLTPGTLSNTTTYPWLAVTRNNNDGFAPSTTFLDSSEEINIFGIEAQPFITEAVSYAMFTDLPPSTVTGESPSGDDEWADRTPGPMPGDPPVLEEVTIDLRRSARNPDYIGEVIGFQITNPFDRVVRLDAGGTNGMLYYIEYAGNAYRLGEFVPPTGTGMGTFTATNLMPGETKVFYCLSWPRGEMERRVFVAGSRGGSSSTTLSVNSFLDAQFGAGRHTQITMIDPKLGSVTVPANAEPAYGILDLHNEKQAPRLGNVMEPYRPALRDGVMIWRVMRPKNSATETAPTNLTANDLLVDRLFDPITQPGVDGVKSLYTNLAGEGPDVTSSMAGDDSVLVTALDNTGFSLVFWGSIRRPNLASGDTLVAGTMPPWCIEARRRDQSYPNATIPATLYNDSDVSDRSLGGVAAFGGPGNGMSKYRTIADMVSVLTSATSMALPQQIRNLPQNKTGNDIPASQSNMLKYSQVAVDLVLAGNERGGKPRNAGLFSRVGDLLIPLAIGPHQEPALGTGAVNAFERLEREWMTLAEVLALCSDYYTPPPNTLYDRVCHEVTAPTLELRRLDRGRLLLDEFVPFIDSNSNGVFNYGTDDRPIGLGIPLALNILDRFRTNSWGSASKVTHGTINPNTAPIATLDAASPLLAPDRLTGAASNTEWMVTADPMATPPRLPLYGTLAGEPWDVSTAIVTYREGSELDVRPIGVTDTGQTIDFTGTNVGNVPTDYGRRKNTLIDGLREEPGFRSIGELLAVRFRDPTTRLPLNRAVNHGMDRLGIAGPGDTMLQPMQGYPGITSSTTTYDRDNNGLIDQTDAGMYVPANLRRNDSYDAKLAIANSLLATMNVRSDVFTCWLLVHGYTQGDVEGLTPEDPLVPTIAKRFVMVVDRSNVVRRGDKPRVLLFKEVPL